ncbi:MAG: GAF domain-containing protein [Candidatus Dormibacteraeota bacterium]|uniref:GAF domain-containing protein n=1 Tax=Candidatus Amunia macphersoniae TaxID=3127014 RepID=A0A934KNQ3_9BACT|nr:GAF domain-containing protein [Candidatus Dormibacteraeota bacterium]
MMSYPQPDDEQDRQAAVARLDGRAPGAQDTWDDITRLASLICETPMALVTVIDGARQWFMSQVGMDATETTRDVAFCAHAILEPDRPMVIPDASEDPIFATNPAVTEAGGIRFYAGLPLRCGEQPLGTLCVVDRRPRELRADQLEALTLLARIAERQFESATAID